MRSVSVKKIITPIAMLLFIFVMLTAVSQQVHAQGTDDGPGLVIMGNDVNGTEGFRKNIIYLTKQQNESMKESRDPLSYGLGDCWISDMRYSSYDNHGTGGWHYSIADGLDVRKLTDAVTGGKAASLKSVKIYSSDSYDTVLDFSYVDDMMYYAPGDQTGIPSAHPMIAYYKTTCEADDQEHGIEPPGPAVKLPEGGETYVYGQNGSGKGPRDDNNCHYIKNVNAVVVPGDFTCFVRSGNTGYSPVTFKDIVCSGNEIRTYSINDGSSDIEYNVRGISLRSVIGKLNIDRYMPDYADIMIRAESSDGSAIELSRDQIDTSLVAWGFADGRQTPAEQTEYMALYTKDKDGNCNVLYNFSRVTITDRDGNVLTEVPQKPVEAPAAVTGIKVSSVSYNSVKLTWSKSENATGYAVYRSVKKSSGYSRVSKNSLTSTSFTDRSLKTGSTYYYKVKALRTEGNMTAESSFSKYISAKPYLSRPSVKLTAGKKKITVKWNRISGASGYKVYRSVKKSSGYKCIATVKKGTTRSLVNSKIKKGKRYYYKVRAYVKVSGKYVYSSYSASGSAKAK